MANTTKTTTKKKTSTKKPTTKKITKKESKTKVIVLDSAYAKTAAIIGGIIISIVQGLAFYSIAQKMTNGHYAASKLTTVLSVGSVILIGIVIVLLFILLISQEDE